MYLPFLACTDVPFVVCDRDAIRVGVPLASLTATLRNTATGDERLLAARQGGLRGSYLIDLSVPNPVDSFELIVKLNGDAIGGGRPVVAICPDSLVWTSTGHEHGECACGVGIEPAGMQVGEGMCARCRCVSTRCYVRSLVAVRRMPVYATLNYTMSTMQSTDAMFIAGRGMRSMQPATTRAARRPPI